MIYQLPKSSYSYWRVGVLFEGPFFPVSIPKRNMNLFIGPLPLGEKVSYDFTTVSLSVGKCVFSKIAHRIFMGIIPANTSKIWFFWFCKKNNWCLYFFGFKSCTIMTFIILLKPHVWEKSRSWVKCKNGVSQSDCRIFKL